MVQNVLFVSALRLIQLCCMDHDSCFRTELGKLKTNYDRVSFHKQETAIVANFLCTKEEYTQYPSSEVSVAES